jgi:hypothetical protein
MTRQEVIDVMGPPDDTGGTSRRHSTPSIFNYGDIELHFEHSEIGKLFLAYTEDSDGNGIVLLK